MIAWRSAPHAEGHCHEIHEFHRDGPTRTSLYVHVTPFHRRPPVTPRKVARKDRRGNRKFLGVKKELGFLRLTEDQLEQPLLPRAKELYARRHKEILIFVMLQN